MWMCECFIALTIFAGMISLLNIFIDTPSLISVLHDRNQLLENQLQLFDSWAKQPLRQKYKFYFFNITSSDRFLRSDAPMTVDEVGPFVYYSLDSNQTVGPDGFNLSSLSLEDLRFNLIESAGDESVPLYALNITLIRRLTSEPHSLLPEEDLLCKTTVRDVLREIVDGNDLSISQVEPFLENDISKELHEDASSSYLQYLRNELCLRLFRVVRFVNPPIAAKSGRFFQKLPCDCLVVVPNGTERMDREDPKYADVLTSKYLMLWDDEHCAESSRGPYIPIRQGLYVTENLFSVSSAAYWRDDGCVQYDHQIENSSETCIKVEQFSDVITDFSFEYQLNIPIKFREEKVPCEGVNHYPILRTVTSGVSVKDVDYFLYHYIVFPRSFTSKYESLVIFFGICILTCLCDALFAWAYLIIRTRIIAQ